MTNCLQCTCISKDLAGGTLVAVEGPNSPLYALEVSEKVICGCDQFLFIWCLLFSLHYDLFVISPVLVSLN